MLGERERLDLESEVFHRGALATKQATEGAAEAAELYRRWVASVLLDEPPGQQEELIARVAAEVPGFADLRALELSASVGWRRQPDPTSLGELRALLPLVSPIARERAFLAVSRLGPPPGVSSTRAAWIDDIVSAPGLDRLSLLFAGQAAFRHGSYRNARHAVDRSLAAATPLVPAEAFLRAAVDRKIGDAGEADDWTRQAVEATGRKVSMFELRSLRGVRRYLLIAVAWVGGIWLGLHGRLGLGIATWALFLVLAWLDARRAKPGAAWRTAAPALITTAVVIVTAMVSWTTVPGLPSPESAAAAFVANLGQDDAGPDVDPLGLLRLSDYPSRDDPPSLEQVPCTPFAQTFVDRGLVTIAETPHPTPDVCIRPFDDLLLGIDRRGFSWQVSAVGLLSAGASG